MVSSFGTGLSLRFGRTFLIILSINSTISSPLRGRSRRFRRVCFRNVLKRLTQSSCSRREIPVPLYHMPAFSLCVFQLSDHCPRPRCIKLAQHVHDGHERNFVRTLRAGRSRSARNSKRIRLLPGKNVLVTAGEEASCYYTHIRCATHCLVQVPET